MKAILTAAGMGTRSGLNGVIRKELLNVYDTRNGVLVLRPIMDSLIHKLYGIGIEEIAVVLDRNDFFTKSYLNSIYPEVATYFQRERNGFGDAVFSAKDFVGKEYFIVAAGDGMILNLENVKESLFKLAGEKMPSLFVMRVNNPSRYGVAVLKNDKSPYEIIDVLEKPAVPPSNYAICAFYYLPSKIFDFITYKDGKAELTDAIQRAIKSGIRFSGIEISSDSWISVGMAKDYRRVLDRTYEYATEKM